MGRNRQSQRRTLRNGFARRFEELEPKLVLAPFALDSYQYNSTVTVLSNTLNTVYQENFSGAAIHDVAGENRMLVPVNKQDFPNAVNPPAIVEYALDSNFNPASNARRVIILANSDGSNSFTDVEAIVSMGNNKFAIAQEGLGRISTFTIDESTTNIATNSPGVSTIVMNPNPTNGGNQGIEGLAWVPPGQAPTAFPNGLFIAAREGTNNISSEL